MRRTGQGCGALAQCDHQWTSIRCATGRGGACAGACRGDEAMRVAWMQRFIGAGLEASKSMLDHPSTGQFCHGERAGACRSLPDPADLQCPSAGARNISGLARIQKIRAACEPAPGFNQRASRQIPSLAGFRVLESRFSTAADIWRRVSGVDLVHHVVRHEHPAGRSWRRARALPRRDGGALPGGRWHRTTSAGAPQVVMTPSRTDMGNQGPDRAGAVGDL